MSDPTNYRSVNDFRPGDIVRVDTAGGFVPTARTLGLRPDVDYVVVGTDVDEAASKREAEYRGVDTPALVGEVLVVKPGTEKVRRAGQLVFVPPVRSGSQETVVAALADRDRALRDLQQARSEVEQAEAAQALEAHRANKAERRAGRLQHAVDYAQKFLPEDQKGRVQGYLDGLRRQDAR